MSEQCSAPGLTWPQRTSRLHSPFQCFGGGGGGGCFQRLRPSRSGLDGDAVIGNSAGLVSEAEVGCGMGSPMLELSICSSSVCPRGRTETSSLQTTSPQPPSCSTLRVRLLYEHFLKNKIPMRFQDEERTISFLLHATRLDT